MLRSSMPIALLALAAVAAVAHAADQPADAAAAEKPWFCHDLDCPAFEVLNKTENYEVRRYEGGKWAATKVESLLYSVAITTGFKRLFDYISGANKGEHKIAMTAPVLTRITPGAGPFCKSLFSVHFYVPEAQQASPPQPTSEDVRIEAAADETFAVTQFGGFLVDDFTIRSKAEALQTALIKDGVAFENDSSFVAGYDPPFRLQHRHNEVWIRLPGKPSLPQEASAVTA